MPLPKLLISPEASRYSASCGAATIGAQLLGGKSRVRLDQLGAPIMAVVAWDLSVGEFAYLGAFYRSVINHGSEPFLIDLIAGYATPVECEAKFTPGGFSLDGVSGLTHSCSATLEVKTPARNAAADAALVTGRAAPVGGLPVMALTPSVSGYSVARGDTLVSSRPGQGPSAIRLDKFNTPSRLTVAWNVGPADFNYLMAFYFTSIAEGALPFLIDALVDHPDVRQLKALVQPGTFSLTGIKGMTYSVKAEVEVVPVLSPDFDAGVLALFEEVGEDYLDVLDLLDRLVNEDMPGWD